MFEIIADFLSCVVNDPEFKVIPELSEARDFIKMRPDEMERDGFVVSGGSGPRPRRNKPYPVRIGDDRRHMN